MINSKVPSADQATTPTSTPVSEGGVGPCQCRDCIFWTIETFMDLATPYCDCPMAKTGEWFIGVTCPDAPPCRFFRSRRLPVSSRSTVAPIRVAHPVTSSTTEDRKEAA